MASNYTPNKGLDQPDRGDYNDQWQIPVNGDTTFIDAALGKTIVFNATGVTSQTLSQNTSAIPRQIDTYSYVPMFITIIGAISNDVTYTIPSGVGGTWIVRNLTTDSTGGPWSVYFDYAGGGTSVSVQRDVTEIICCDTTPSVAYRGVYKPSNTPTDNSVTTASIQDGAVTYAKLNSAATATVAEYRAGNIGAATITGSAASTTTLTVTAVTGTIIPGMVLSGGSPAVASGTTIVSQSTIASGASAGGAGTYLMSGSAQTAGGTITATMPGTVVSTATAWDSASYVTLTDASTITPDFAFGYNFQVTLNGVRTLANPANVKVGQSGLIVVTEGSTQTTSSFTGYIGASFSGTISGTTLTANSTVGTIILGAQVSGSGVAGTTTIVGYGSGSGGDGTYYLNTPSTVSSPTAMTISSTTLTVTGSPSAMIYPGMTITTGALAGTTILSGPTAGGAGSYVVSIQQNAPSTSMVGSIGPFFASYGTYYKFAGGVQPTFSKSNGNVNVMAYSVIPGPYILLTTYAGVA